MSVLEDGPYLAAANGRMCQMSEALKSVGAITLFVEDLAAAKSFYERVFGRTASFGDDSSAGFKF
jgi:predicted enzyme related to lactoylglutathione lyase